MTHYLVEVALGPVQEFIIHARRSRDLWFGSHILSELSRAVARSLAAAGFTLVFPALAKNHPELEPCRGLFRDVHAYEPPLAVSNIVLAHSPDITESALEPALTAARTEALEIWRGFAGHAATEVAALLRPDARDRVIAALDHVLEFTAAWEPLPNPANATRVPEARDRLAQHIASRKSLRDFSAWDGHAGHPKSSLDGYRESVLRDDLDQLRGAELKQVLRIATRFRIPLTEHLDGLGVVKRAGGTPRQFIPLARIALAPWIEGVRTAEPVRFADVHTRLAGLLDDTTLSGIDYLPRPWLQNFPFDGEVFLEDQWKNHVPRKRSRGGRGLATEAVDTKVERAYEAFTNEVVRPLLRGRKPDPYIACLVADGDRMGRALDARSSIRDLQRASDILGKFAAEARSIILDAMGNLVYAGGDDVLAFVPVTRAVGAAAQLAATFLEHMGEAFPDLDPLPTLSVGIGIGHVLTPMGELLQLGRDAEKIAKAGPAGTPVPKAAERNAFAILSERRGGARVALRQQWIPTTTAIADTVNDRVARFLAPNFPHGLPYEVRSLLSRFPALVVDEPATHKPPAPEYVETIKQWALILASELRGVLVRKRLAQGTPTEIDPEWAALGLDIGTALADPSAPYASLQRAARRWVDESLVIRHLALAARAENRAKGMAAA